VYPLKAYALDELENDIIADLLSHEIRFSHTYGNGSNMVDRLRVIINLYDQFSQFSPPTDTETPIYEKKKTESNTINPSNGQRGKGDVQDLGEPPMSEMWV
jgi:hypothetical protein